MYCRIGQASFARRLYTICYLGYVLITRISHVVAGALPFLHTCFYSDGEREEREGDGGERDDGGATCTGMA